MTHLSGNENTLFLKGSLIRGFCDSTCKTPRKWLRPRGLEFNLPLPVHFAFKILNYLLSRDPSFRNQKKIVDNSTTDALFLFKLKSECEVTKFF